ncbi:thioredoxin [Cucumibacter marinus]|uniref:thioredoxin n=1 Tax=Cucumibacter marinus TaxID=1121252 RepID=UPI00048BABC4|nr:thioredoxin [Cucumibacter marinus]
MAGRPRGLMGLKAVSDGDFDSEVMASDVPVLVDFWAEWCAPCKAMDPVLEDAQSELGARLKIVKLNSEENVGTVTRFNVRSMPTYLVFKNGEVADMHVGATLSRVAMIKWLEGHAA